jgi:hypothetical protein
MKVPRGSALNLADLDGAISEALRLIATDWGFPGPKLPRVIPARIPRGGPWPRLPGSRSRT